VVASVRIRTPTRESSSYAALVITSHPGLKVFLPSRLDWEGGARDDKREQEGAYLGVVPRLASLY
jgi:hypothetical protein